MALRSVDTPCLPCVLSINTSNSDVRRWSPKSRHRQARLQFSICMMIVYKYVLLCRFDSDGWSWLLLCMLEELAGSCADELTKITSTGMMAE